MEQSQFIDSIIYEIYKHLPIKTILNCSLVSKQFNDIANSEQMWKYLCLRDMDGIEMDDMFNSNHMEFYKYYAMYNLGFKFVRSVDVSSRSYVGPNRKCYFRIIKPDDYSRKGIGVVRCNYMQYIGRLELDVGRSRMTSVYNDDDNMIPKLKELNGTSSDDTVPNLPKFIPYVRNQEISIMIYLINCTSIPHDFKLSYDEVEVKNKYIKCSYATNNRTMYNTHMQDIIHHKKPYIKTISDIYYFAEIHNNEYSYINYHSADVLDIPFKSVSGWADEYKRGSENRFKPDIHKYTTHLLIYTKNNFIASYSLNIKYYNGNIFTRQGDNNNEFLLIELPIDTDKKVLDSTFKLKLINDNNQDIWFLTFNNKLMRCIAGVITTDW